MSHSAVLQQLRYAPAGTPNNSAFMHLGPPLPSLHSNFWVPDGLLIYGGFDARFHIGTRVFVILLISSPTPSPCESKTTRAMAPSLVLVCFYLVLCILFAQHRKILTNFREGPCLQRELAIFNKKATLMLLPTIKAAVLHLPGFRSPTTSI
jgi:hypothetical protein